MCKDEFIAYGYETIPCEVTALFHFKSIFAFNAISKYTYLVLSNNDSIHEKNK